MIAGDCLLKIAPIVFEQLPANDLRDVMHETDYISSAQFHSTPCQHQYPVILLSCLRTTSPSCTCTRMSMAASSRSLEWNLASLGTLQAANNGRATTLRGEGENYLPAQTTQMRNFAVLLLVRYKFSCLTSAPHIRSKKLRNVLACTVPQIRP